MKYTVIYVEGWKVGNGIQSTTRMKRIELQDGEILPQALLRENVIDNAVFIFEGWPKLDGE